MVTLALEFKCQLLVFLVLWKVTVMLFHIYHLLFFICSYEKRNNIFPHNLISAEVTRIQKNYVMDILSWNMVHYFLKNKQTGPLLLHLYTEKNYGSKLSCENRRARQLYLLKYSVNYKPIFYNITPWWILGPRLRLS